MLNLSSRQIKIIKLLANSDKNRFEIGESLLKDYDVSKVTLIRDLNELIKLGFIKLVGTGPATTYSLTNIPTTLPIFNLDEYFQVEVDKRNILGEKFNFDLINSLDSFFEKDKDLEEIEKSRVRFKDLINNKNSLEVKQELERFIIELSWKSSKIEGNTYTLLDTENLIKNNIKSKKILLMRLSIRKH